MAYLSGAANLAPKTPKRFKFSGSGTVAAVAAVSGKKIRLVSLVMAVSAAATVVFKSAATDIGSPIFKAADPPLVLPPNYDGWVETVAGERLDIVPSTGTVSGFGTYVEI